MKQIATFYILNVQSICRQIAILINARLVIFCMEFILLYYFIHILCYIHLFKYLLTICLCLSYPHMIINLKISYYNNNIFML